MKNLLKEKRTSLTMWEAGFIDGMQKRLLSEEKITPVQAGKIEEIHRKYVI